jgi:hypothetical protein
MRGREFRPYEGTGKLISGVYRFILSSPELYHRVMCQMVIIVAEKNTASIFAVQRFNTDMNVFDIEEKFRMYIHILTYRRLVTKS